MKKFIFLTMLILGAGLLAVAFLSGVDASAASAAVVSFDPGHIDHNVLGIIGSSLAMGLPIFANMSREELEDFAENNLSDNFEGFDDLEEFDNFDDEDLYDGFDDPEIQFLGSARSFLDEKKNGVYLSFKIINNSGYSKVVALSPAYFNTIGAYAAWQSAYGADSNLGKIFHSYVGDMVDAGNLVDAVIGDGVIFMQANSTRDIISCTGTNGKIADHLNFIRKNPVRIPEMVISSVKTSTGAIDLLMYSKIMTVRKVSAYRKFGDTNIDLNDFFDVKQVQSGKIIVDTARYKLQLDDQTLVFLEIDHDITLNITMKIGGIANYASKLYHKAETANRNIQRGTAGKVPADIIKARKGIAKKQMNVLRKMAFGRKKKTT